MSRYRHLSALVVGGLLLTSLLGLGISETRADPRAEDDAYPANACEIFVDRVAPSFGTYGSRSLNLWVKTLNFRLDSPIRSVVMRYRVVATPEAQSFCSAPWGIHNPDCHSLDQWQDEELRPFVGSPDYWELPRGSLLIGVSGNFTRVYEAYFTLRTEKGTALRTFGGRERSPVGVSNFVLDDEIVQRAAQLLGRSPTPWDGADDPRQGVVTADGLPYLNPLHCR